MPLKGRQIAQAQHQRLRLSCGICLSLRGFLLTNNNCYAGMDKQLRPYISMDYNKLWLLSHT